MVCVSQITPVHLMLYTLNLQNAVCQLHVNKTGKEKDYEFFPKLMIYLSILKCTES